MGWREKIPVFSQYIFPPNFQLLMETNQGLLSSLGVSHPTLDLICRRAGEATRGRVRVKLTGAGGGGCAFALLVRNKFKTVGGSRVAVALEQQRLSGAYTEWGLN